MEKANRKNSAICVMKKMGILLTSVLVAITLFSTSSIVVKAEEAVWGSGDGSAVSPYLIETPEDLLLLAKQVNEGNSFDGVYFKMTRDLDLSMYDNWTPIGFHDDYFYFSGIFDGGEHTISNMKTIGKEGEAYRLSGLFGCVKKGTIKNVTIDQSSSSANGKPEYGFAGGLIGVAYLATVENCRVSNSTITVSRTPNQSCCAGGLAGYSASSTFINSGVYKSTILTTCYGGGLIGELDDDYEPSNSETRNCYVIDSIVKASSNRIEIPCQIGGFVGSITMTSAYLAENCFVSGVRLLKGDDSSAIVKGGMFSGVDDEWSANNCYVDATLAVDRDNGAFGKSSDATFSNCYYNNASLIDNTNGLTGLTPNEMKSDKLVTLLGDAFVYTNGRILLKGIDFSFIIEHQDVPIKATAMIPKPTYVVTIPTVIEFGEQRQTLEKYRNETVDQFGDAVKISIELTISATNVANLFDDLNDGKDDHINVSVAHSGNLVASKNVSNQIPFVLLKDTTELATGAKIATFYNDVDLGKDGRPTTNVETAQVIINRADIKEKDTYSTTLTFTIAIADR